jgi:UDP-galactopyranose mutase
MQYRSLVFERFDAEGDHQGNAVINYCEQEVPYTRIAEHKHFTPWESHEKTVLFREFSKATEPGDVPYYPMRLASDKDLLARYVELAEAEEHTTFIGRLGTYRYLDMHVVMRESLELAAACLASPIDEWPSFSAPPV